MVRAVVTCSVFNVQLLHLLLHAGLSRRTPVQFQQSPAVPSSPIPALLLIQTSKGSHQNTHMRRERSDELRYERAL